MTIFYRRIRVRGKQQAFRAFVLVFPLCTIHLQCKKLGWAKSVHKCVLEDLSIYATMGQRKVCTHCLLPRCGDFSIVTALYGSSRCFIKTKKHSYCTSAKCNPMFMQGQAYIRCGNHDKKDRFEMFVIFCKVITQSVLHFLQKRLYLKGYNFFSNLRSNFTGSFLQCF